MKVLVIIPTKLDSTRLEKKNIRELNGKPMFIHSVDYAKQSKHQVSILVSSDSSEVKSICEQYGVYFDERSKELCGDTEVVDVYLDVVNRISHDYDLVVGLQPDNPNRSHALDECIDYMIENKYDDLITVNPNYKRSGSVRIFKYEYLKSGQVSKRLGCIKDDAVDVHYESDLELVKEELKKRLYTKYMKYTLKNGALKQIGELKQKYGVNPPNPIIADIGANIGYFSESFLEVYPECELHAYEPQPDNLNELRKLEDSRFTIHEYGLFDSDGEFEIGMRSDGKSNNGTYSIFNKENLSSVPFKNANNETIRPHIVKMDVEGAEANILECEDFFSETQAILIELVYKDDFGMNEKTEDNLKKLGFKYKCHLGKNDQLWLK